LPGIVTISSISSDGLYISAAAALCQLPATQCDTAAEALAVARSRDKVLFFVDLDSEAAADLINQLNNSPADLEKSRLILVALVHDVNLDRPAAGYPDHVKAVLQRPLGMDNIVQVLKGFVALD